MERASHEAAQQPLGVTLIYFQDRSKKPLGIKRCRAAFLFLIALSKPHKVEYTSIRNAVVNYTLFTSALNLNS